MKFLINFFSDPVVLFSIVSILGLIIFTVIHFNMNVKDISKNQAEKALRYRFKADNKKTRKREQLNKIGKKESKWKRKYRMAVSSIKIALGIGFLSVENFTTMFLLFGVLVWVVASFLLNNIVLGLLVAIPSILAALAFLLVVTKRKIRANDNAVMEALDAICPMVDLGVTEAVKVNMNVYDQRIVRHMEWFTTAIEFRAYDFDEAMDELSNRLGPRFEEFSRKAKVYNEDPRDGMEDIFKDIIETNNDVRGDNADWDEISAKKNNDLLLSSSLLMGFLVYMYVNPQTSSFMVSTFWGSLVATIAISMLITIYAVSQIVQVEIPDIEDEG